MSTFLWLTFNILGLAMLFLVLVLCVQIRDALRERSTRARYNSFGFTMDPASEARMRMDAASAAFVNQARRQTASRG